jgi:hypothetical protein
MADGMEVSVPCRHAATILYFIRISLSANIRELHEIYMKQSQLDTIREQCRKAIGPLRCGPSELYFYGQRTISGRLLPPNYLVYFLLVDLLGFKVLGRGEKVAWSIVLLYKDKTFVIEHRKMGFGLFSKDKDDPLASSIVDLVKRAVDIALPYFEHRAQLALGSSEFNLLQRSHHLLERFEYLVEVYELQLTEALAQKDVFIEMPINRPGASGISYSCSYFKLKRKAEWIATAAIEAFFSWTEHFFIHLALLRGKITSGTDVAVLASADWSAKYKFALDLDQQSCKDFYDKLLTVRRQVRNFVAHGAFGKNGEAFHFHSPVGAVPVYLRWDADKSTMSMHDDLSYDDETAIALLKSFVLFIKSGPFATASQYINEYHLDTIMTFVMDGTYRSALKSTDAMDELIERMNYMNDMHANMDW